MLPFKLVYSDAYYLPIGEHVFPAEKYRRIRDQLIASGVADPKDFLEPQPATDQDILLVHKPEYVQKLKTGTLSPREEMEMEDSLLARPGRRLLAGGGRIDSGRPPVPDRQGRHQHWRRISPRLSRPRRRILHDPRCGRGHPPPAAR